MSGESLESEIIEREMGAIIFYLTAFGYIDGDFDQREKDYIEQFIEKLVTYRARVALKEATKELQKELATRWTKHFQEVFVEIDSSIQSHFTESVADGEDTKEFVNAKLKLRCYELFRQFHPDNQAKLLLLADELIHADGEIHPNEATFRKELEDLLASDQTPAPAASPETSSANEVMIDSVREIVPRVNNYDFFQEFERHYLASPDEFEKQAKGDLTLIEKTIAQWNGQRQSGQGKLVDAQDVSEFAGQEPFLDRHIYVYPPNPKKDYELLVLGDLHGCYSCLKAALMQADFFAKVDAHHLNPDKVPAMKLVLLGDYIDRGRFSYNGILRTVMQLFLTVPDHVYILRGNHEYYVELNGRVYGGVRPAEAINSLEGIAKDEVFVAYKRLFEAMPNMMMFGKTLFVHAGIPRDDTLAAKWHGLDSLNDPEIRFQMLWSDPSEADYIPTELQKSNARFPFGQKQFKSFMARVGCNMMFRGHERVVEGFKKVYTDPDATLLNLFSAGGCNNADLPPTSNYREVTPMAVTMKCTQGVLKLTPFRIDWERYNRPEYNNFFKDNLAQKLSVGACG
jgi:hypothetical protein